MLEYFHLLSVNYIKLFIIYKDNIDVLLELKDLQLNANKEKKLEELCNKYGIF